MSQNTLRSPLHYRALTTAELTPGRKVVHCTAQLGVVDFYEVVETTISPGAVSTVVLKSESTELRHVANLLGLEPDSNGKWDNRHYILDAMDADLADDVHNDVRDIDE